MSSKMVTHITARLRPHLRTGELGDLFLGPEVGLTRSGE